VVSADLPPEWLSCRVRVLSIVVGWPEYAGRPVFGFSDGARQTSAEGQ
jgi:hypothetical protein